MSDLDALTFGTVIDMYTEMSNDSCETIEYATQDDMNNF